MAINRRSVVGKSTVHRQCTPLNAVCLDRSPSAKPEGRSLRSTLYPLCAAVLFSPRSVPSQNGFG